MLPNRLFRYTTLPGLMHLLMTRQITLLSYEDWEDKNDVVFLRDYEKRTERSVFALCFTEADETFHHWKVFADGPSGVRITFDKDAMTEWARGHRGMRCEDVRYRTYKELQLEWPPDDELPFTKRHPYRDEREVRLIYECTTKPRKLPTFDFDLQLIKYITLSPWLSQPLRESLVEVIGKLAAPAPIKISKTGVTQSETWERLLKKHS